MRPGSEAVREGSFSWASEKCLWGDVCRQCKDSGEEVKKLFTERKRGTHVKYKRLQASRIGHKWLERLKVKSGHRG